ncbi:MAG: hypothetical protein ACFCVH_02490 [Alphaproteobacteria bacterium]
MKVARARSFLVAGSLAALTLSAYGVGVATAPAPASAQQNCPIDTVLYEQVSQLQTRALLLENQWQQRSTVIGPFRVVDDSGAELAWIGRGTGGLPEMTVGGPGVTLGYESGKPYVQVSTDGQRAGIALVAQKAAVYATASPGNGFFAESSAATGLQIASIFSRGSEVANLGVMQGRRAAVRLLDGPRMLAGLGIGAQGAGQLIMLNPDNTTAVNIGGDGGDGGFVNILMNDREAASMSTRTGSGGLAIFNTAGTPVAFFGARGPEGGIVAVSNSSGQEVVRATHNGDVGSACVMQQNGNETCLAPTLPLQLTPQ